MTDDQMAQNLFGDSPIHGDAERVIARQAIENELATPEQAATRAEAWGSTFQNLGLNSTESHQLAGIKPNPTDEQRAQWQADSRAALRQDYGDSAGQALQDTQKYIAKHPELREHLRRTGLGDHPQWVRIVAAKARAARTAGKL